MCTAQAEQGGKTAYVVVLRQRPQSCYTNIPHRPLDPIVQVSSSNCASCLPGMLRRIVGRSSKMWIVEKHLRPAARIAEQLCTSCEAFPEEPTVNYGINSIRNCRGLYVGLAGRKWCADAGSQKLQVGSGENSDGFVIQKIRGHPN